MVAGNAGTTSSLEVVREFLESLQGRAPRPDEVRSLRPALEDLEARVQRIRKLYPACAGVALSEEIERLIWMAKDQDQGRKDQDEGLWRSAASLL